MRSGMGVEALPNSLPASLSHRTTADSVKSRFLSGGNEWCNKETPVGKHMCFPNPQQSSQQELGKPFQLICSAMTEDTAKEVTLNIN